LAIGAPVLASCDVGLTEGTVVAALSANGRILVGQLRCDGAEMPARVDADVWRDTGDRAEPTEQIWAGHLARPAKTLPSSDVDLFATYDFVSGRLGAGGDTTTLADSERLGVVLVFSGAADLPVGEARRHPGEYFYKGARGSFEQLRSAYCKK
jgi:hypothetical protein